MSSTDDSMTMSPQVTEAAEDYSSPAPAASPSMEDPNVLSSVLQDALGITPTGTCLRHPNCPVMMLDGQRIMSCRVCFSEEKSVGITQRKSFSAVVHQLQRMKPESQTSLVSTDSTEGASMEVTAEAAATQIHPATTNASSSSTNADTSSTLAFQQPQALESIMKRLSQVQNWMLRQKEKEVMSLQLTIHRLEQRLKDSETTVDEQKQTIMALRKTIQQDLKIIKTMATQKEKELEASGHSRTSTTGMALQTTGTDAKKAPRAPAGVAKKTLLGQDDEDEQDEDVSESELYSPIRKDRDSSKNRSTLTSPPELGSPSNSTSVARSYATSPPKTSVTQRPGLGAAAAAMSGNASGGGESSMLERRRGRKNLLERTPSTLSLDASVTIPEEIGDQDEDDEELLAKLQEQVVMLDDDDDDMDDEDSSVDSQENSIFAPPQRSEYWTDADMSMASDPSKIFASFRGGLLDIPKSPPPNRHDKRAPKKKLQIQIDNRERGILRIPSMRTVVRSNSGMSDATGVSLHNGIPTGLMSSVLQATPFDSQSDFSQSPASTAGNDGPLAIHGSAQRSNHANRGPPSVLNVPMFKGLDDDSPQRMIAGGGTHFMRDDSGMTGTYSIESLETYQQESERSLVDTKASATAVAASKLLGKPKHDDKELFTVNRESCQDKYGDPGMYTGTILATEGLPHGRGTMNYESGRVYDGEWLTGHWNGKGKLLNPNGDIYEGEFVFDARHGHGVYKWDNGDVYVGHFSQDKRHGKGKFSFHNGNVYEGEFVDGMFEGFGKYSFADGYYEGDWKQGRYDGNGELRYTSGGKYTGEFRNSVAHGFGMEISPSGKTRRGVWQEGKPVNF